MKRSDYCHIVMITVVIIPTDGYEDLKEPVRLPANELFDKQYKPMEPVMCYGKPVPAVLDRGYKTKLCP